MPKGVNGCNFVGNFALTGCGLAQAHPLTNLPPWFRKVAPMLSSKPSRQIVGALLGCALCFSSTAAGAATTASIPSINPWVALSAFGTPASASAVCVAGAATISAAQAPAAGCVLPVVDLPPPAPIAPAPTPAFVPAAERGGIGILPILAGLAVIAGIAALLLLNGDDDDNDDNEVPVSPA
jgi:hypothetical protein